MRPPNQAGEGGAAPTPALHAHARAGGFSGPRARVTLVTACLLAQALAVREMARLAAERLDQLEAEQSPVCDGQ